VLLGNCPERVTLIDGVEHGLLGVGRLDVLLDLGHAQDITNGEDRLLFLLLALRRPRQLDGVAVELDLEVAGVEAEVLDLLLEGLRVGLGRLSRTDAELLAGVLAEVPQPHSSLS
jgi:hypothetical protein